MRWWFALIGFVLGRWPGAMLGYLAGWLLEEQRRRAPRIPRRPGASGAGINVVEDLLTLSIAVAGADGRLDRREIRVIRHFFEHGMGFSGPRLRWLQAALKHEAALPGSWMLAAARLRDVLAPHELALLLRVLAGVALADGRWTAEEQRLLAEIAARWNLPVPVAAPPAPERPDRRDWARRVLGVDDAAGTEEIERAYKRLVREKHPDRFAHLGDEFAKAAHEQFVEIQEAYRVLTRE